MSVTFNGIREDGTMVPGERIPETGCLCSQLDPTWDMYLEGSDRDSLARSADPNCPSCRGTGVEPPQEMDAYLNFHNDNARVVLSMLGLAKAPSRAPLAMCESQHVDIEGVFTFDPEDVLFGERSVPEMRQRIMVARARFEKSVGSLVRDEEEIYGKPYIREDGVVELRPLRCFSPALTPDDIYSKLQALAVFVEEVAAEGAVKIFWG